jgi:hypothetical protein
VGFASIHLFHIIGWYFVCYGLNKYLPQNGRYFAVHTVVNLIVTYFTFSNTLWMLTTPFCKVLDHFMIVSTNDISVFYSPMMEPVYLVFSLHIFHIHHYFRKMHVIEWVHHLVMMIGVGLPTLLYIESIAIAPIHGILFFVCGLPGAMDYGILVGVKYDVISAMSEKWYNLIINISLRSPGLLFILTFILQYIYVASGLELFFLWVIIFCTFWNAQYFLYVSIASYFKKMLQEYVRK